jgi:acetyltransferase
MFNPKTVALIGASDKKGAVGRTILEMEEKGKKSMIGVARLIMNQDLTSGEIAVLVQDKFQGKRLGTKFVEVLIEIARERGLEEVRADVLTENEHMLKVFGRLGFSTQWFVGGTSEAVLKLKEQGAPGE